MNLLELLKKTEEKIETKFYRYEIGGFWLELENIPNKILDEIF